MPTTTVETPSMAAAKASSVSSTPKSSTTSVGRHSSKFLSCSQATKIVDVPTQLLLLDRLSQKLRLTFSKETSFISNMQTIDCDANG